MTTASYDTIVAALEAHGLRPRGAFHPVALDAVPALSSGQAVATLVLAGNAGPGLWPVFSKSPEFSDGAADPLNRWSKRVLDALAEELGAEELGAEALFPFTGPPYRPFIAWAKRAEAVSESPLGMLIHPDYGLWHAYRGALAFGEKFDLPAADTRPSPCLACQDKPCLGACPVDAFSGTGYDVAVCAAHISTPAGLDCLDSACRARRACPTGRDYHYNAAQARFHMDAFLRARPKEAKT